MKLKMNRKTFLVIKSEKEITFPYNLNFKLKD